MNDYAWFHYARNRSTVVVTVDGREVSATLVAWKSHRSSGQRRQTARVEFASGRRLSVPCETVRLPPTSHTVTTPFPPHPSCTIEGDNAMTPGSVAAGRGSNRNGEPL